MKAREGELGGMSTSPPQYNTTRIGRVNLLEREREELSTSAVKAIYSLTTLLVRKRAKLRVPHENSIGTKRNAMQGSGQYNSFSSLVRSVGNLL